MGGNDCAGAVKRHRARAGGAATALIALTGLAAGGANATQSGGAPTSAAQPPTTAAPPPPTTAAPQPPPTTAAPPPPATTATTAPLPSLPAPDSREVDPVRVLVPSIVVHPEALENAGARQPVITRALEENRNAVAVEGTPSTLCAVVPVLVPVMAAGRWERNGKPIAASDLQRRDPPGYGECITNDGEPFDAGVYQYVAVGQTGANSAAVTLVLGASTVAVLLVNNGDAPVCEIHISPRPADFYEAFEASSPLQPGEAIAIRVAAVDQDFRIFGCPVDKVLTSFRLEPQAQTYVDTFDDDDDGDAEETPDPTAPTGTPGPTQPGPTTTTS